MRTFTYHVDFLAENPAAACDQAYDYSEALTLLRPQVDGFTAQVSAEGGWRGAQPVFCTAMSPDLDDTCVLRVGEHHLHQGARGEWADSDVPRPPDTPESL